MTKAPTTWAEFNDVAEKMKAAGMTPIANGGIRWDDGMKFEIALAGISPDVYRRAIMKLDDEGAEGQGGAGGVRAAAQARQLDESRTSPRRPGR